MYLMTNRYNTTIIVCFIQFHHVNVHPNHSTINNVTLNNINHIISIIIDIRDRYTWWHNTSDDFLTDLFWLNSDLNLEIFARYNADGIILSVYSFHHTIMSYISSLVTIPYHVSIFACLNRYLILSGQFIL